MNIYHTHKEVCPSPKAKEMKMIRKKNDEIDVRMQCLLLIQVSRRLAMPMRPMLC